jgi:hypothetical protein
MIFDLNQYNKLINCNSKIVNPKSSQVLIAAEDAFLGKFRKLRSRKLDNLRIG